MHWQDILGTVVVWNIMAFALGSFPPPTNQYARWFVGVLQFIVANRQKMAEAFNAPKPTLAEIAQIDSKKAGVDDKP